MTVHDGVMDWLERALEEAQADDRLGRQLRFVLELDKAKSVLRRTYVTDGSRLENDGEHMWHVMLAGLVLAEHADEPVDPVRLALMLAVHDIVEIDAGDTFVYADADAQADKVVRELAAAERIFGLLPEDQRRLFAGLWEEFEARETPLARMAAAIDRLLPLMMNRAVQGRTWREHGIRADQVMTVNSRIGEGSAALWSFGRAVLEAAEREGFLET
ncbi:MAG: HD domain-containing protein [Acidimicrobiales bacterium]|jgi:putative hydrolase of HD superfamily